MKLIDRSACPLCGSKDFRPFKKGSFDPRAIRSDHLKITDSHYGSLWHFSKCRNCGFVFSNPTIGESDLNRLYGELEDGEYSLETEGRSRNFTTLLKRLEKIEKPGDSLLDVGAASGIFLNLAREQGYEVAGIEPSAFLVEEARKLFNLNLFRGTIDRFPTDRTYSVIALVDILEHLADPSGFMKQLTPLLRDRGVLVGVTPDINSLAAKIFGRKWWHYRIAHLNFFNRPSLTYLLEQNGFEIIGFHRYAWHFSAHYLLTRIFPGLKDKKSLQKILKKVHLTLQLFDSWEVYARKN